MLSCSLPQHLDQLPHRHHLQPKMIEKATQDQIIALVSLLVALAALVVAAYAIYRGNRNTSASTLVTLNEALRQAWERLLPTPGVIHIEHLADLMNLFEIACGINLERSLAGVSKKLMSHYLNSVLRMLINNSITRSEIPKLLHDNTTFQYIKKFLGVKRKDRSVTVPLEWYESYE